VVPGVLHPSKVKLSPFLPFFAKSNGSHAAAAAADTAGLWEKRKTLLFFHGSICWQTYDRVHSMEELRRKCARKHGFIDHYSFGVRYEVYRRFKDEPRFLLRATEFIPPPPSLNLDQAMLTSVFCLCPSGTGWGMRAFHAAVLGCIPVVVQDDGSGTYPSVLQAFEGLLLDWDEFSVRLRFDQLPSLPRLLRALESDEAAMRAKRLGARSHAPPLASGHLKGERTGH